MVAKLDGSEWQLWGNDSPENIAQYELMMVVMALVDHAEELRNKRGHLVY